MHVSGLPFILITISILALILLKNIILLINLVLNYGWVVDVMFPVILEKCEHIISLDGLSILFVLVSTTCPIFFFILSSSWYNFMQTEFAGHLTSDLPNVHM